MLTAALLCLVVGISDGDTISARCPTQNAAHPYRQIKVRFQGIDAPERKQPFGNRAREALSELVYMKEAELRCNKIDRYKRHICSVWVAPASAAGWPAHSRCRPGYGLCGHGLAVPRHYAKEQSPQERGQYKFAEQEANARKVDGRAHSRRSRYCLTCIHIVRTMALANR